MAHTRDIQDVVRQESYEPSDLVPLHEAGPRAGSYVIPAAVIALFVIAGILLFGNFAIMQGNQDVTPPATVTTGPAPGSSVTP
jgi:hypothetical protein